MTRFFGHRVIRIPLLLRLLYAFLSKLFIAILCKVTLSAVTAQVSVIKLLAYCDLDMARTTVACRTILLSQNQALLF